MLRGESPDEPARAELAAAVRLSARTLEQIAPGSSVEVRCRRSSRCSASRGRGKTTRGTPPNVVETDHADLAVARHRTARIRRRGRANGSLGAVRRAEEGSRTGCGHRGSVMVRTDVESHRRDPVHRSSISRRAVVRMGHAPRTESP
ncbi:hypothetical protein GS540_27215 [Rhodococcus hoagii]|nr:hypothetical protein [Prescottella equi]